MPRGDLSTALFLFGGAPVPAEPHAKTAKPLAEQVPKLAEAFGHLLLDGQSWWTGLRSQLHEASLACMGGAPEELSAVRGHVIVM